MLRRIKRNELARNFFILLTGTALAQVIVVAVSPVLTRLFSAEAFGIMGIFLTLSTILGTVSNGRYDLAIMLPPKDYLANRVFFVSLFCAVAFSLVLVAFLPARGWLSGFFDTPGLEAYLVLLPVSVLMIGLSNTFDHWLARDKAFKMVSSAGVAGAIVSSLFMIIAGLLKLGAWGLVIGGVLNHMSKVICMAYPVRERLTNVIGGAKGMRRNMALVKRYADFPKYRAPQDFINSLSQNVPILLLGAYFGAAYVGFFWLANRVMVLPAMLVAQSLRKVLFQRISVLDNEKLPLFAISLKLTLGMLMLAMPPLAIVVLYGEWLFGFVFGSEWQAAGLYAGWLAVWALFDFAKVPAVVLVSVLQRNKFFLVYTVVSVAAKTLAMFIAATLLDSDVAAVAAFSLVSGLLYVVLISHMLLVAWRYDRMR